MTRIKLAIVAFPLALLATWILSVGSNLTTADSHALGVAFTQITGILSIGMMAFGNLLAIRPTWLEPLFDGLDKMYRLHKWLGIGGLSVGVIHWLTATGDGHRPPAAATTDAVATAADAATTSQGWMSALQGPAHGIAQPALWILFALVAVALIGKIPYKLFAKTHILVVAVFLALAFHSIVLMQAAYWSTPIGWLNAALIAIGSLAALISLARYLGAGRRARGEVLSATYFPELHVVEAELRVNGTWAGHQPGQFAFVTTDWKEGAHPFTIATHWNPQDRRIGFIAKELGDHTARLRDHFDKGRSVTLEGPYGQFTFDSPKSRQIWVGGGIGITPFVAKMRQLAVTPGDKQIDLFHSTTDVSELALEKMRADAASAGVTLHILVSPRDGHLTAARIMENVPDWKNASLWFCGPTGFGASLRKDLTAAGLPAREFHQELFEMR